MWAGLVPAPGGQAGSEFTSAGLHLGVDYSDRYITQSDFTLCCSIKTYHKTHGVGNMKMWTRRILPPLAASGRQPLHGDLKCLLEETGGGIGSRHGPI